MPETAIRNHQLEAYAAATPPQQPKGPAQRITRWRFTSRPNNPSNVLRILSEATQDGADMVTIRVNGNTAWPNSCWLRARHPTLRSTRQLGPWYRYDIAKYDQLREWLVSHVNAQYWTYPSAGQLKFQPYQIEVEAITLPRRARRWVPPVGELFTVKDTPTHLVTNSQRKRGLQNPSEAHQPFRCIEQTDELVRCIDAKGMPGAFTYSVNFEKYQEPSKLDTVAPAATPQQTEETAPATQQEFSVSPSSIDAALFVTCDHCKFPAAQHGGKQHSKQDLFNVGDVVVNEFTKQRYRCIGGYTNNHLGNVHTLVDFSQEEHDPNRGTIHQVFVSLDEVHREKMPGLLTAHTLIRSVQPKTFLKPVPNTQTRFARWMPVPGEQYRVFNHLSGMMSSEITLLGYKYVETTTQQRELILSYMYNGSKLINETKLTNFAKASFLAKEPRT